MKSKKLITCLAAAAICVPALAGVVGCGGSNPANISPDRRDVYATSALTSALYLQGSTASVANQSMLLGGTVQTRPSSLEGINLEDFTTCINMFDDFLGKGTITQTVKANDIKDTDANYAKLKDYTSVMTITLPSFETGGKSVTYSMYYKELGTKTNTEIDEDVEEVEESTTLAGTMVVGEELLTVEGERTYETSKDEVESSIQFTTYSADKSKSITVSQSIEVEDGEKEVEYAYSIKEGDTEVFSTEVEFEKDKDGKNEIEFELSKSEQKAREYKLEQVQVEAGQDPIYNIEFVDENGSKVSFKVTAKQDGSFEFNFGKNAEGGDMIETVPANK